LEASLQGEVNGTGKGKWSDCNNADALGRPVWSRYRFVWAHDRIQVLVVSRLLIIPTGYNSLKGRGITQLQEF